MRKLRTRLGVSELTSRRQQWWLPTRRRQHESRQWESRLRNFHPMRNVRPRKYPPMHNIRQREHPGMCQRKTLVSPLQLQLPWLHLSGRGQGGIVKTPNHCGPAAKSVSVSSFAEASVVHRLHTGGCGVGMACNAMSCLWSCHAVSFGIPLLIPCQPLNSQLGGNMRSLFHILFVTTPFTSIGRPLLICMRLQSMTHRWPFIGSAVAQPYKATWSTLALQSIQSQFDDSSCVCRLPEHRVACSLS